MIGHLCHEEGEEVPVSIDSVLHYLALTRANCLSEYYSTRGTRGPPVVSIYPVGSYIYIVAQVTSNSRTRAVMYLIVMNKDALSILYLDAYTNVVREGFA